MSQSFSQKVTLIRFLEKLTILRFTKYPLGAIYRDYHNDKTYAYIGNGDWFLFSSV